MNKKISWLLNEEQKMQRSGFQPRLYRAKPVLSTPRASFDKLRMNGWRVKNLYWACRRDGAPTIRMEIVLFV